MTEQEFQSFMIEKVSQLITTVNRMDKDLSGVKEELAEVKANMATKEELAEIKASVIRIEHEHGNKLAALKDGWLQHEDKFSDQQKELREQFDDIRTDTRYLVRRVSSLEKLVK